MVTKQLTAEDYEDMDKAEEEALAYYEKHGTYQSND